MTVNWRPGRKPAQVILNNVDTAIWMLRRVRDRHLATNDASCEVLLQNDQDTHICFAIEILMRHHEGEQVIQNVGDALQKWITRQFARECVTYDRWLLNRGYNAYANSRKVQASRRAWIDNMINELERSKK